MQFIFQKQGADRAVPVRCSQMGLVEFGCKSAKNAVEPKTTGVRSTVKEVYATEKCVEVSVRSG